MKKFKCSLFVLVIIVSTITCTVTLAGKDNCPDHVVHCAYITGLLPTFSDGRYLKVHHTSPKGSFEFTTCFNSKDVMLNLAKDAGTYTDAYSICSNADGQHCEPVDVDIFKVDSGTATPKFYNIDLSNYKNRYPTCESFAKQHKI